MIQTLAIPVLPFEKFIGFWPTWQEWGICFGVLGYGMLIYSLSYRYLPLFPQEAEIDKDRAKSWTLYTEKGQPID